MWHSETRLPASIILGNRASEKSSSRKLRSSEGCLLFLFAHYQNRAVCVSDDAIGYTPHQRSSYSGAAAAAHYYQTRSYFLAQANDLLIFPPPPKIGFLDGPPSLLDLLHLFVEYLLSFLADRLACFLIGFPTEASFVHCVSGVRVPRAC